MMPQNKVSKNFSNISDVISSEAEIPEKLTSVLNQFTTNKTFRIFEGIKSKGFALTSLFRILIILPFAAIASVYALTKSDIKTDIEKDAFYDLKNNFKIDWRKLLYHQAKVFKKKLLNDTSSESKAPTALIFDDSLLPKTGKRIEKIGYVHNHVGMGFILGFKILVCGYFDGKSFIPLDFSLHREKGNANIRTKLKVADNKAQNTLDKITHLIEKLTQNIDNVTQRVKSAKDTAKKEPTKTNIRNLEKAKKQLEQYKVKRNKAKYDLKKANKIKYKTHKELKNFYSTHKLFGLTQKERKNQFDTKTPKGSHGHTRRKETDESKNKIMLDMISRAVKNGFIPDYVLIDSWFFSQYLLDKLKNIKKGCIKLISMVKINNQKFTLIKNDKEMNVKAILKSQMHKQIECRKFKAKYIKVECKYKGHNTNLFFIKMGKSNSWHLLLTTDLSLSFIKLIEVYQIRWTIEVFFKESKQLLNLGKCQSNNFDAQIADTTISLVQYILIGFYKRINVQMTFNDIFKKLNDKVVQNLMLIKLIRMFWKFIEIFCKVAGIDMIELQADIMKSEDYNNDFLKFFPHLEWNNDDIPAFL